MATSSSLSFDLVDRTIITGKPLIHNPAPPLSAIENLPTEIIQHVACYLQSPHNGSPLDTTYIDPETGANIDGLLNLRMTSRTMRAKTAYTFNRSIGTYILNYDDENLRKLLVLSTNSAMAFFVHTIIFVASEDTQYGDMDVSVRWEKLHHAMTAHEIETLAPGNPIKIVPLIAVLRRFIRLSDVRVAPSLLVRYPPGVVEGTRGEHPPTSILNAVLRSRVSLLSLDMGICSRFNGEGVMLGSLWSSRLQMETRFALRHVTALTLSISGRDLTPSSSYFAAFRSILGICAELRALALFVDKATLDVGWPYSKGLQCLWLALAVHRYANLHTLVLGGFTLDSVSLFRYLNQYRTTLKNLGFDNCSLNGPWTPILSSLREFPALRKASLFQVSQGIQRVLFPDVCSFPLSCLPKTQPFETNDEDGVDEVIIDEKDWCYIGYVGCPSIYASFEDPGSGALTKKQFGVCYVSITTIDPRRPDSIIWKPELLRR